MGLWGSISGSKEETPAKDGKKGEKGEKGKQFADEPLYTPV